MHNLEITNNKEAILHKCLHYFTNYGIREMSNQKLVLQLGISTKTLYKHFLNKEDLLEHVLHLYHDLKYQNLLVLFKDLNHVCQLFEIWKMAILHEPKVSKDFYLELSYYYPSLASKVDSSISKKFSDHFLNIINAGIENMEIRKDIRSEIIIESFYVMYLGIVKEEKLSHLNVSFEEIANNTILVLIRGICTKTGLSILQNHINSKPILK